jgi:hypothetical protein
MRICNLVVVWFSRNPELLLLAVCVHALLVSKRFEEICGPTQHRNLALLLPS